MRDREKKRRKYLAYLVVIYNYFKNSKATNTHIMDELRFAQLLKKDISDAKKLEILKDLDIKYIITGNSTVLQNETTFIGYNLLHIATMKSDLDLIQKLLSLGVNPLQHGTRDGKTPLHKAVDKYSSWTQKGVLQEYSMANMLLSAQIERNNSYNAKSKGGISHLHIACMFNHAKAVLFLSRSNDCVNERVNNNSNILPGYTPLHYAIRYSSSEAVAILLTLEADIYLENAKGLNSVDYLIKRLLKVNDNMRMTCSNDYYCERELERLNSILKLIVLKNQQDDWKLIEKTGLTAFHLACMLKDNWIAQSCLMSNVNYINQPVSCKSKYWPGWTPLHFAACNMETFKSLFFNDVDARIKNAHGESAFEFCFRRFNFKALISCLSTNALQRFKSRQLSELLSDMNGYKNLQQFLQNLKDINSTLSFKSVFLAGYNLLHISVSMRHRIIYLAGPCYLKNYGSVHFLRTSNNNSLDYWITFEMILKKGCSFYSKNADGSTPIHLAFKLDEWHVLEELLARVHKNVIGPGNSSFLHIACAMGKIDVVERLLKNGVDVNSPVTSSLERHGKPKRYHEMSNQNKLRRVLIRKNSTPLHIAVLFGMEAVVEKLLQRNADVHAEDELGLTPLHLSLASTKSIARLLLNPMSDLKDVRRQDGLSYLHVAAFADDEKAIEKLLQNGADINGFIKRTVLNCFVSFIGKTPLHLAVESEKAARVLIEKGADILAENPYNNYKTPLDLAVKKLNTTESKFPFDRLNRKEIRTDALTASGLTTLHIACATLNLDWARTLLKRKSNPNLQMKDGEGRANTPMHLLISSATSLTRMPENFRLFIELLLKYKTDLNISNNYVTPIHLIANIYFEQKCWPDSPDDRTYLLTIADLMLSKQKSNVSNFKDVTGFSYFHLACVTNNQKMINNYLDNGIDINHRKCPFADENGGFTSLHFAIKFCIPENENEYDSVVPLLLRREADVKAEDAKGNTPLHLAVHSHVIESWLIKALLGKGADINAKNLKNETPLMCFLSLGNICYKDFHFFINFGSFIDITKVNMTYDGQGIIGFMMENTRPDDIESVLRDFMKYFNVKDAIDMGFLAVHSVVSIKSSHLTCEHYLIIFKKLMEKGSDIDEQDENGKRALDKAISFENLAAVKALFLLGVDVNVIEDENGDSSVAKPRYFCCYRQGDPDEFIINHLWKMAFFKLDLNFSIQSTIEYRGYQPQEKEIQVYQAELKKIANSRIYQSLNAKHFLSEYGRVINYPTMSIVKRQAIDDFFKRDDELRKEFPEFAGLLAMQYRKAVARVNLIQLVKNILVEAGMDLPDLCLEANATNEELHPRKRRRIQ